jgi:RNA polymerase sigma-70 factor (ECF subfamily)
MTSHSEQAAAATTDDAARERALIERARSGDRDAFDELVAAHLPRVWNVVWRVVRHREDAEDVTQEVFVRAWRALPEYRAEAKLSTWLHRIAMNVALNHADRASEKARRQSVTLDPERDARPAAETPIDALEAEELRRRLAECLDALPPAWRAALALREGSSMSYDEMARALGIALGTVRSRLARARVALKECVEEGSAP